MTENKLTTIEAAMWSVSALTMILYIITMQPQLIVLSAASLCVTVSYYIYDMLKKKDATKV